MQLLLRGDDVLNEVIAERQSFIGEVLKDYTDEEYVELLRSLELLEHRMEFK